MKIGFDAKRYISNQTGLGNYSRWLIDGLKSQLEAFVLYHPKPDQRTTGPKTALGRMFPSLWRTFWLYKDLKRDQIDVYHGLSNELPKGIHRTGIKTVVTIHDLIQKRYPENYSQIDRTIYNSKVNYAQKIADVVIVPSEQTKNDLSRFFGTNKNKIKVIPLGAAPIPTYTSTPLIDGDYILCISGLSQRKNIVRLIKAFTKPKLKGVQLVIAGKAGDRTSRVAQLVAKQKHIKLIVNPSTEEIHQLYHYARFCVYPSLFEGFGIPVLEAFQHGKTLALSHVSSLPEVGGDAALYFNPTDVEEMSECISKLFFSQKQREHLESKIPLQLAQFEPNKLLGDYFTVYKALIGRQTL